MIEEATVRDVVDRTDIVECVGRYVPLKRAGAEFKGLCPFHNEKSPSFTVSPSRGTGHCYGCGWHGDAARFLMDHKGLSFPDAIKELAGPLAISVEENARPQKVDREEYEYRDPDSAPAEPVEPRQRPRPKDDDAPPFDWEPCVRAFADGNYAKGYVEWRGGSEEFAQRMNADGLLGIFRGCFAYPVHDADGHVIGCHYATRRPKPAPKYLFHPKGIEKSLLVVGDPKTANHTIVAESQGDAYAVLDSLGYHEEAGVYAAIITRGVSSDISAFEIPAIIAIPQNDPEDKRNKKTLRTPAEQWLEHIRESRHKGTRLLVGHVPEKFKDANDWIRDGNATPIEVREALIETARDPLLAGFKSAAEIRRVEIVNDPNSLIGYRRRWLGRGGSLLFVGPSGIGKSTLMMLMAVSWAAGIAFFGIEPRRPMKVLIIQAENDEGDLREMIDGAFEAMGVSVTPAQIALAESNILFRHETTKTGLAFCRLVEEAVNATGADLVIGDPLMSYLGDDISSQKICSEFLRTWLQPVLARTGAIMAFVHHTGKTSSDSKARSHWSDSDDAYLGMGSSELTNWARSIATLKPASKDSTVFRFTISKRGGRAGMTSLFSDGPVKSIFIAHAEKGLGWREVEAPEPEPSKTGGRKRTLTEDDVLKAIGHPSAMVSKDQLVGDLVTAYGISDRTVRNTLNDLRRKGLIEVAKTEPRTGGGPLVQYLRQLPS